MKNNFEEVDRLSRESLQEWEARPPAHIAENIHRRLFWTNFWRQRISRISFVAVLAILGLGSALVFGFFGQSSPRSAKNLAELSLPLQNFRSTPLLNQMDDNNGQPAIQINTPDQINNYFINPDYNPNTNNNPLNLQTEPQTPEVNNLIASLLTDPVESGGNPENNAPTINNDNSENNVNTVFTEKNSSGSIITSDLQSSIRNDDTPFTMNSMGEVKFGSIPSMQYLSTKNKFSRKPVFSLLIDLAPQFANTGEKKNDLVSSSPSMLTGSASLLLQYHIKNWFFESGLQYTRLQTKQTADFLQYNPENIITQILTGQELLIDTSGYWYYKWIQDSVIHIYDSTWVTEYDSNYNNIYQDLSSVRHDTLANPSWKTSISLFEIPLGVGYRYSACHTEFSIKAGVMLGISSKISGLTYLSESSMGLVPVSELYSSKRLQYSYYISAGIARQFTEDWSLILSPSWRSSINGFNGNEGIINRKYSSWGLGLGMRYEF